MRSAPRHSFSIPSVHDSLKIDCRLYHPEASRGRPRLQAALLAHPYAPLGGSYDDPVIGSVGSVLLKQGFMVGTFNFRGARGSSGRTSWTGKPELADYVSFYLFMVLYLPHWRNTLEEVAGERPPDSLLILGGYSYGSMIAAHLPSLDTIVALMEHEPWPAAVADIHACAEQLAAIDRKERDDCSAGVHQTTSNAQSRTMYSATGGSGSGQNSTKQPRHSLSLRRSRPGSKESRNRSEGLRQVADIDPMHKDLAAQCLSLNLQVCYFLISPLLSTVAGFTTLFSRLDFSVPGSEFAGRHRPEWAELEQHPSCAIYGDSDTFTSSKRLNKWTTDLQHNSTAGFRHFKVEKAGHFWHEAESQRDLKNCLNTWLHDIVSPASS